MVYFLGCIMYSANKKENLNRNAVIIQKVKKKYKI